MSAVPVHPEQHRNVAVRLSFRGPETFLYPGSSRPVLPSPVAISVAGVPAAFSPSRKDLGVRGRGIEADGWRGVDFLKGVEFESSATEVEAFVNERLPADIIVDLVR